MARDKDKQIFLEMTDALAAEENALRMEEFVLDIADMNLEACPPDRRIFQSDKEAWVYEHGNISELVFVKAD